MIRNAIKGISQYTVDQTSSLIKLNQNECPYDIEASLKEQVLQRMRSASWNRYPDSACLKLRQRLEEYTGHPAEGIVIGNSSNEMINMVYSSCCRSGDRIVIIQPGFLVFKRLATIMDLDVVEVPLKDDFSFDIDGIVEAAKDAKLVMLASPNNPTGTWMTIGEIDRVASSVNCIFALDEAYFEYAEINACSILSKHQNLVIIRTFSKGLSLAGLRIGYLLGSEGLCSEMGKAKMPFSVGLFSQIAGEVILENRDFIQENAEQIIRERKRVFSGLEKIDHVIPYPSQTNFILFRLLNHSAAEVEERMKNGGILIRRFEDPRLIDKLRVCIGLPEENDAFLELIAMDL